MKALPFSNSKTLFVIKTTIKIKEMKKKEIDAIILFI
jgi:hypothetical protein